MKARSAFSAAGAALAALLLLANCSSDKGPGTSNNGGALAAGSAASAGGRGGSSGSGTSSGAAGASSAGISGGGAAGSNSAGAATNGGGSTGNTIEASFKTFKGVLGMSCYGSGCHSDAGNPLQMELDDKLYGTLTSYTTRTCGKLLNTANPAQSALIKLLEGSCNGVSRMPYGVCVEDGDPSCIAPEYIAALKAWIARGAPQ